MKYHLITDTHFNHVPQMFDYCGRPENYQELLANSMLSIPEDDVLIHLGDICIGKDSEVHERFIQPLKCKKWLIRGNHDNKSDNWYLTHGWDFVADAILLRILGVQTLLTHIPHPDTGYGINIHGHFHNQDHRRHEPELRAIKNPRQYLLAVEFTNYKAVDAENWISEHVLK